MKPPRKDCIVEPEHSKAIGHTRLAELRQQGQHIRTLRGFGTRLLETEYADWLRKESAPSRRWLMWVPFFAMVLAPVYGTLLLDSDAPAVVWLRLIEFGLTAPLCGLSIFLLYRDPDSPLTTRVMLIAGVVVFWAVALIRWVGAAAGGSLSPEIVMVVPLALAAVGRLRLFLILPMIIGCSLLFLLAEWHIKGASGYAPTVLGTVMFAALSLMTAIATDRLTRRAWLDRQIAELSAMSDAITGLPNRQWLNRDMGTLFSLARRNQEPLAVYLIDLDHFKKLNDTHGHAAGDVALRAVGKVLARFGRRALDLAGRYGGEEFVLILHKPKHYGAARIAEELVQGIAALGIENQGAPLGRLTASIGVYIATPGAEDRPEDFLQQADAALYAAKHGGRNRYLLRQPQDRPAAAADDPHGGMEVAIQPS